MTRRSACVALVSSAMFGATLALAAPAFASDPSPAQAKMLMQPSELPAAYGKATADSFQSVDSGGVFASVCAGPDFSTATVNVKDSASMFSNAELNSGETWAQSIFVYPSKATARKAYEQLTKRSLAKCQGTGSTTRGDDDVKIPRRTTVVATTVDNGIITSTAQSTSKGGGKAPYADSYTRSVSVLNGNAIENLSVFGPKPIDAAKAAKQDALLSTLAGRYQG